MDVETQLRVGLAEKAGTVHMPVNPYESFVRRERQHRRTRRTRIGAAALVVAAVAGVSGVVALSGSDRRQAAEVATPDSPEEIAAANQALLNSPLRGSLADDREWLSRMRARAVKESVAKVNGTVDQEKVKLLYAGVVADGTRQVVAYVPLGQGPRADAAVTWFEGPPDDDRIGQMAFRASFPATEDDTATFALTSSSNDSVGWVLAVGPEGSTIRANTGVNFQADGTVGTTPETVGAEGSGVLEMELPPGPNPAEVDLTVTRQAETQSVTQSSGTWSETGVDTKVYRTAIKNALGDRKADLMPTDWLRDSLQSAGATVQSAEVGIPWIGKLRGERAVVFTIHEPGQGVLVFAYSGNGFDYRVLMPAEGAEKRPIAYRLRAQSDGNQLSNDVHVIAPPGTQQLMLEAEGSPAQTLELDRSRRALTQLDPDQKATVIAYDATGKQIGVSPVLPFDEGGALGQSEGTRLVP